jgi:hypothetical protein
VSTIEGGRWIVCDDAGCHATALALIALQPLLNKHPDAPLSTKGWLFVLKNERTCHFCPRCAPHYLNTFSNSEHEPQEKDQKGPMAGTKNDRIEYCCPILTGYRSHS